MTLRDQLLLDQAVFLNEDDFGETVVIDGVSIVAVVDDDFTDEQTRGPSEIEVGVFARHKRLHFATGQIDRPVEGQRPILGTGATAEKWYVRRCTEAEGMLEVVLERHET